MDNKNILIMFLAFMILLACIGFFYTMHHRVPTLPDESSLVRDDDFYKEKYADTITYLSAVYPTCVEVFKKMSPIDLALFYNSLWFYYNCASEFNQNLGVNGPYSMKQEKHCWQAIPGCGSKYPILPYVPQGYLYSYQSWINNSFKPWIYSDSTILPKDLVSFAPGGAFWNWNIGPAPMFSPQRAIQRVIYGTVIPSMKQYTDAYGKIRLYNQPSLVPGLTGDWKSYWNYPKEWYKGIPDNGYIEITGFAEPGMPISVAAIWLAGIPGTGVFYNVGKSKRSRNKVDVTFLLAQELASTEVGKALLEKNYGTSDPYKLIQVLIKGGSAVIDPTVWEPTSGKPVTCSWNGGAGFINVSVPYNTDGWNTLATIDSTDQGAWCSSTDLKECVDNIRAGRTYQADRIAAQGPFDEALTWMGVYLGYDSLQFIQSSNGTGFWQFEIAHLRDLPAGVKNRDYSSFIELAQPCKPGDYNNVKWRESDFMVQYIAKSYDYFTLRSPFDVTNEKYVSKCIVPHAWQLTNLKSGGDTPENQFNITCSNNMSDMNTDLAIFGDGNHPNQCYPGGVGYKYQPMTSADDPPFS